MILMPSVSTPLEVSSATVEKATREMASPAEVSAAKQDSMNEGLSEYYYTPFSADIDECTEGLADCDDNTVCENNPGSFECLLSVENRDECEDGSNTCSLDADCTDMEDGYTCSCRNGFRGDGKTCRGTIITMLYNSLVAGGFA